LHRAPSLESPFVTISSGGTQYNGEPIQRAGRHPEHELVTDGLYRFIRHPSYLGMIILMVGWALAFRSAASLLLVALVIPPLLARPRSEEVLLRTRFGERYDAYCRRTWRLIPGLY
jgi:protein-S-isoprenylcysteine O-methyltransferase Ste14